MPILINSHADMELARARVSFCYLCGAPLSQSGPKGVSSEHIFARGASDHRVTGRAAWNATLPVHKDCEDKHKKPYDDELIALQRVHCRPLDRVVNADRKRVWRRIKQAEEEGLPASFPVVSADSAFRSIWATVRGMHTLLYGSFVPATACQRVMSPSPSFSSKSGQSIQYQVGDEAMTGERILRALDGAILAKGCDGVTAWGNTIRYRCLWHLTPNFDRAMCMWFLATPEVRIWSRSITGKGIPWRGLYLFGTLPIGAAVLSESTLEHAVAEIDRQSKKPALMHLIRNAGRATGN